jgi:hypothetical protein
MAYEQKDNSGSLFVNERKEKDTHPDRQGTIMVDGREYWISGWLKKTQDGTPWLSLSVKPKEKQGQRPQQRPTQRTDDFEDAPF